MMAGATNPVLNWLKLGFNKGKIVLKWKRYNSFVFQCFAVDSKVSLFSSQYSQTTKLTRRNFVERNDNWDCRLSLFGGGGLERESISDHQTVAAGLLFSHPFSRLRMRLCFKITRFAHVARGAPLCTIIYNWMGEHIITTIIVSESIIETSARTKRVWGAYIKDIQGATIGPSCLVKVACAFVCVLLESVQWTLVIRYSTWCNPNFAC